MRGRGTVESKVREHIRQELSLWTPQWEQCLNAFASTDLLSEEEISALLTLTQRTRNFFRLLDDSNADNTAVALESVLTLTPTDALFEKANISKAIQIGIQSLWDTFSRYPTSRCPALLPTPPDIPPLPFAEQRLLLALDRISRPKSCDSPCETFKIIHSENDTEALKMRSLDLFRLEEQAFSLYLIEIAWEDVLARNGSLSQMLDNLGRNGYVFDIRPSNSFLEPWPESHSGQVLRVLHASPLDIDFLEALTRLPVQHIHSVNATRIRRNLPSWGKTIQSAVPAFIAQSRECCKDIRELVSEYDLAFASLVKRSRQEIPAFAASELFANGESEDSLASVSEDSSVLSGDSRPSPRQPTDLPTGAKAEKKNLGQTRSETLLQSLFF